MMQIEVNGEMYSLIETETTIEDGWEPIGGVTMTIQNDIQIWSQAMIKVE